MAKLSVGQRSYGNTFERFMQLSLGKAVDRSRKHRSLASMEVLDWRGNLDRSGIDMQPGNKWSPNIGPRTEHSTSRQQHDKTVPSRR